MKTFYTLLLSCCMAVSAHAQPNNLPLGSDYHLINVKDGSPAKLSQYKNPTLVLLFVQNECAFVERYQKRITKLLQDFGGQDIRFVLINPNTSKDPLHESQAAMKKKLSAWGWSVDYLADVDQLLTQKTKVHKVPLAVVIQSSTGDIWYKGPIDDNPQVPTDVEHPYLQQALQQIKRGGTPSTGQKIGMGCMVQRF